MKSRSIGRISADSTAVEPGSQREARQRDPERGSIGLLHDAQVGELAADSAEGRRERRR